MKTILGNDLNTDLGRSLVPGCLHYAVIPRTLLRTILQAKSFILPETIITALYMCWTYILGSSIAICVGRVYWGQALTES